MNSEAATPDLGLDQNDNERYVTHEAAIKEYYVDVATRHGLVVSLWQQSNGRRLVDPPQDLEVQAQLEQVMACELSNAELLQLLIIGDIPVLDRSKAIRIVRSSLLDVLFGAPRDLAFEAAEARHILPPESPTPEQRRALQIVDFIYKGLSLAEAEEYFNLMERRNGMEDEFYAQAEIIEALRNADEAGKRMEINELEPFKSFKIALGKLFSAEEQERIEYLESKIEPVTNADY